MEKLVVSSMVALIFTGILIDYWVNKSLEFTMLDVAESYNNELHIQITEPNAFQRIWSAKNTAHGHAEWYSILHYKNELQDPANPGLTVITEDTLDLVNQKVAQFISNTSGAYMSDDAFRKNF